MTADLTRARIESGAVIRVERFGSLVELTASLPHLAATAQPGHFAQLRCGDGVSPLLRRPFSVAFSEGETCTFVFEEVGRGTRLLGALQPGDTLDVLGPLGRGFTVSSASGAALIVSGGAGCAPFPLLVRALLEAGVSEVTVCSGASTASRLYPAERFRRGAAIDVREATDDGSRGTRGRVTDLAQAVPVGEDTAVYACGPNRMLAALWDVMRDRDGAAAARAEASLEAPMGCGYGTCLGCALPVRAADGDTSWALCCCDGPVMPMREVDWQGVRTLPAADVA